MRRRLVLLVLAALLPLLVLTGGLAAYLLRQEHAATQRVTADLVEDVLGDIERETSTQIELLKVLSQSPLLDTADLRGFHTLAIRFKSELPLWDRIILADLTGQQVVNTGTSFGHPLHRIVDPEGFERVVQSRAPVVGNLTGPGPLSGGIAKVSFRAPVIRDGQVRYVLTATVDPRRLAALVNRRGLDPQWRPFLVDASGRLVAAPRSPELVGQQAGARALAAGREGGSGVYAGVTADGVPVVTVFRTSATTGWSAHLAIPTALYNAPVNRATQLLAAAGLLALALMGLFAYGLRREVLLHRGEARFRARAERMEALGRMTGGVAHDFNNLLMVILGNADMLQRRLQGPQVERYLGSIRKAAEKGSHLTRELLAFARSEPRLTETVDLNQRVEATLAMVRQSLSGSITVELDFADGPLPVKVDPIQLDLALLNVAVNARDAMPDGGELRLSTRRAAFPDRSGREGVALAITDTGSGIPEAALPHVFEPFFTTKEVGKGTGLGLSQVYGFAKGAGGLADIESRAGRGTTVTFYLPLAAAEASTGLSPRLSAPAAVEPSKMRVLLVDDSDEVRTVAADYLTDVGFVVTQAPGPRAALEILSQGEVDVLVSDLVMPGGMDGLALAQEARGRYPNLPVVLITGYSASAETAQGLGYPLIRKPFEMAHLAEAVRKARSTMAPVSLVG